MLHQGAILAKVGETDAAVTNFPGTVALSNMGARLGLFEDLDRLLPRKERPTGVVFASATGFDDGAKALVKSYGPPTVILMGGREDGGWDVTSIRAGWRSTIWLRNSVSARLAPRRLYGEPFAPAAD